MIYNLPKLTYQAYIRSPMALTFFFQEREFETHISWDKKKQITMLNMLPWKHIGSPTQTIAPYPKNKKQI